VGYVAGPNERFRTGDLVQWHGGHSISFVSREAGSHIKVRGFKVFPELIEAELIKHPDIEAAWCAAVGDEGDDTSSRLEAAVALTQTATISSGTVHYSHDSPHPHGTPYDPHGTLHMCLNGSYAPTSYFLLPTS